MFVPVAQLDRVFGYEPKGQGFESLQARQKRSSLDERFFFFTTYFYLMPKNRYSRYWTVINENR